MTVEIIAGIRMAWNNDISGYIHGYRFVVTESGVGVACIEIKDLDGNDINKDERYMLQVAVSQSVNYGNAKRTLLAVNLDVYKINNCEYSVNNPLKQSVYNVVKDGSKYSCSCPDHNKRKINCKHINAVKRLESIERGDNQPLIGSYAGRAIRTGGRGSIKTVKASQVMTAAEAKESIGL